MGGRDPREEIDKMPVKKVPNHLRRLINSLAKLKSLPDSKEKQAKIMFTLT